MTLNEELEAQARSMTNTQSEVIETLPADFLAVKKPRHAAETQSMRETIETWNRFAEKHGSFADEHSTL